MIRTFVFILSMIFSRARGALLIGNMSYPTQTYLYYGPSRHVLTGIAVAIDSGSACDRLEDVAGKIVLLERSIATCPFEEYYVSIMKAGALALVEVWPFDTPGFLGFRHHTWNEKKYASDEHLHAVRTADPSGEIMQEIRSSEPRVVILTPPGRDPFVSLYLSWEWTLIIRVLAPAFAAYGACLAAMGLYRERGVPEWSVRHVMYVIELPCLCLAGASLALGQYGPFVMPVQIHNIFNFLMNGGSIFTSILVALFLRETQRHLKMQLPRPPLRTRYPTVIATSFLCFFAYDFFVTVLWLTNLQTIATVSFFVLYAFAIPVQLVVAVFFLYQARNFPGPIRVYLFRSQEDRNLYGAMFASVSRVGRLAFWLAISGVCSIATVVGGVVLVNLSGFGVIPMVSTSEALGCTVAIAFGRIGASVAQIIAVRADPDYQPPSRPQQHDDIENLHVQPRGRVVPDGVRKKKGHKKLKTQRQKSNSIQLSAIAEETTEHEEYTDSNSSIGATSIETSKESAVKPQQTASGSNLSHIPSSPPLVPSSRTPQGTVF